MLASLTVVRGNFRRHTMNTDNIMMASHTHHIMVHDHQRTFTSAPCVFQRVMLRVSIFRAHAHASGERDLRQHSLLSYIIQTRKLSEALLRLAT